MHVWEIPNITFQVLDGTIHPANVYMYLLEIRLYNMSALYSGTKWTR